MKKIIAIIITAFIYANTSAQTMPVVFSKGEADTIKCSLDGVNWFWVKHDVLYRIRYVSNRDGTRLDMSKFELKHKGNISFRIYLNSNGQKRIQYY